MLKDLFDFRKTRTAKEAVVFYVFYTGAALLLSVLFGG